MFDINKNIDYVPFFIQCKYPFKDKKINTDDYILYERKDGTKVYFCFGPNLKGTYSITVGEEGHIIEIEESFYENEDENNRFRVLINDKGMITSVYPTGEVRQISIEEAYKNQDIVFGDNTNNIENNNNNNDDFGGLDFPNSKK